MVGALYGKQTCRMDETVGAKQSTEFGTADRYQYPSGEITGKKIDWTNPLDNSGG